LWSRRFFENLGYCSQGNVAMPTCSDASDGIFSKHFITNFPVCLKTADHRRTPDHCRPHTADHPRTARKTSDHSRIQVFILYVTLCRWRTQS